MLAITITYGADESADEAQNRVKHLPMGTIDTDSLEKRDGPENDPTRTTNSPNYGSHLFTRDVGHTFMVVDAGNRRWSKPACAHAQPDTAFARTYMGGFRTSLPQTSAA